MAVNEFAKEITKTSIEDELTKSYLDYAMSVIVGRALPDVRDGLKPVHRRTLYAMYALKNDYNKPYKKSARIVGDIIGKYHPHGDTPVYDTIVRMAQDFSMRYVLIDGQGNFGSVDGDKAAAMRYTEIRLARIAHAMMDDLDKETVDFVPNYDETEFAPSVLPTRFPNLLLNGSSGIAVGMATNIPPHNLGETIDACIALIHNPDSSVEELMQHLPGPDFPTAGFINGRAGIVKAYKTGRGKIYLRARASIETNNASKKTCIIVTELPYQINKARLIEKIADLVRNKAIEGITAIRDESDKQGMRIVIEIRRGDNADVVLNNLYSQTAMQSVFGINMVTLNDNGHPSVMNLKQVLNAFIRHRRDVVTRRTLYELRKARQRAHILEGLGIALVNIDSMIALIKASPNPAQAKEALRATTWPPDMIATLLTEESYISRPEGLSSAYGLIKPDAYQLSPEQAQAILDLKLHRLTGLEKDKIFNEYREILEKIHYLLDILNNPDRLMAVIVEELEQIKAPFNDERLTEITASSLDLIDEDLIPEENIVITLSREGYVKTQPLDFYQAQNRGGKGRIATRTKEEDFVDHVVVANTHDTILCFSNAGRVYWLKGYQLPQAGPTATGKPIVNFLPLAADESISAILSLKEYLEDHYLFMATEKGYVKKVPLVKFSRPRSSGVIALELGVNDRLIGVKITQGSDDVLLFTDAGKAIRFDENTVRSMGRTARGVRGVRLKEGQKVISLIIPKPGTTPLIATEKGYGKRTAFKEFRVTGRGKQGVIAIQVNARNGKVVAVEPVADNDEALLISDGGVLVRLRVNQISSLGRNTQGVRLINLNAKESLISLECIPNELIESVSESELADSEDEGEGTEQ